MKVGWIETGGELYGGHIYNSMARESLAGACDVEHVSIGSRFLPGFPGNAEIFLRLLTLSGSKDIWIREIPALFSMGLDRSRGKNIALIHHDDFSGYSSFKRMALDLLWRRGRRNLSRCDWVVTVSKFWRDRYMAQGLANVRIIYNAFKLDDYEISQEEAERFKQLNGLDGRPIVYLGNCQRAKGVMEAYEALKDLELNLVTSGYRSVRTPARNLQLAYGDYLKLLKASSIVLTMSRFDEGWCRTAHEAMLVKTPVIGSGRGGMRELLEGGGQLLCENVKELKGKVSELLSSRAKAEDMAESGRKFAESFTLERFKSAWIDTVESLSS